MSEMTDPVQELRGVSSPTDLKPHVPPPPAGAAPRPIPPGALAAMVVAGIAALGYFGSWWAVAFVFALFLMITLHELGHYLTAKWAGMKVTEFFIGFGPRIWSFRRGETEYGIKPILVGAYVRIIGMHNLDPVDPADEPRTYRQQPYWRRMSVAVAGSTMHFILAFVVLFALFAGYGEAHADNWRIGSISKLVGTDDSPAVRAGLQLNDRLVAINGAPIHTFQDAVDIIRPRPGQTVTLTVERKGQTFQTTTQLADHNPSGEEVGFLGIGEDRPLVKEGVGTALVNSVTDFGSLAGRSVQGLGQLFSPSGLHGYVDNVFGTQGTTTDSKGVPNGSGHSGDNRPLSPIGAVRLASQAGSAGLADLLGLFVIMNIFIGIFNLVPLLPLDGGHVAIATYEKIRSRRGRQYHADVAKLLPLTYAVVAVLGLLFLTSAYLDIFKPVSNPFGK